MFKTNRDYPFIHDAEVTEWDIKSANTSVMAYYNLVEPKLAARLAKMPKMEREIAVGNLQKKHPEFAKQLEDAFNKIINEFMEVNNLTMDDVVSIKRDAVFVRNHPIKTPKLGGEVEFVPKNRYKHVILVPRYEVYIADDKTDVKGLADEVLPQHEAGMIYFLRTAAYTAHDFYGLQRFFHQYVDAYKKKELDFDAYREFTSDSKFRVTMGGHEMLLDSIEEEEMSNLDISFNYMQVVMPTIQATY